MNVVQIREALESIESAADEIGDAATIGEAADVLEQTGVIFKAALRIASAAIAGSGTETYSRCTWMADIRMALDSEHEFLGRRDFTVADAVAELRDQQPTGDMND